MHGRQKSFNTGKNFTGTFDKASKHFSPNKFEHNSGVMNTSLDADHRRQPTLHRRALKTNVHSKEIQSARTTHNKKGVSQSRNMTVLNLTRKDFDLEKFRALFGRRRPAERRLNTEQTCSNTDIAGKHRKQSSSINIGAGAVGKKATNRPLISSKNSQKQVFGKRNSHRGKNSESTSLAQRLIASLVSAKDVKRASRSKESELRLHDSSTKQGIKITKGNTKQSFRGERPKLRDDKSTSNMLKSSSNLNGPTPDVLNSNDFGFLFSKKLTNLEKMSLIQQKSQLLLERKRAGLGAKLSGKPSQISIKQARLATNYSVSDSVNIADKQDRDLLNAEAIKESYLENQELEDQLELAQKSSHKSGHLASDRTNNFNEKRQPKSNLETPMPSKKKFSKKLFGRRKSFCEENPKERLKKEIGCDLDNENISMTSDARIHMQNEDIVDASGSYQGRSDLQRSNSNILLRSIVSASSNHLSSREMPSIQEKIEVERQNLIAYIKDFSRIHKTVPKTTLQFYKIIKLLGRGSFGKVHLGVHLLSRKKVAIKCIDKQYIMDEKAQGKVIQEIKILRGLSHKNIVKILEVFENKKYVFIVTDYAAKGDVLQYMKDHGIFKESKAKSIAAQILNGLEYIHKKNILHRDIKLDNILLDKDFRVKICDFGVSRLMPTNQSPIKERCGTPAYIAPEIIKNQGYSGFSADVSPFSLRCGHSGS